MAEEGQLVQDLLWVVKFYEGGVTLDSLMNMPTPELQILVEQTELIARKQNG